MYTYMCMQRQTYIDTRHTDMHTQRYTQMIDTHIHDRDTCTHAWYIHTYIDTQTGRWTDKWIDGRVVGQMDG